MLPGIVIFMSCQSLVMSPLQCPEYLPMPTNDERDIMNGRFPRISANELWAIFILLYIALICMSRTVESVISRWMLLKDAVARFF